MDKKGSVLLFFVVQLIGIILFFIVLFSLLSMTQTVRFTISEFDENTEFLLITRRLVTSADCFAYEERNMTQKENTLLFARRVYPGVVDVSKLFDYEHFNCIRRDYYDKLEDVRKNVWDPINGTGAAVKYDVSVVNLTKDGIVYLYNPDDTSRSPYEHLETSLLARINKKLAPCANARQWLSIYSPCCDKIGYYYDDYGNLRTRCGEYNDSFCDTESAKCPKGYVCTKNTYSKFIGTCAQKDAEEYSPENVFPQWRVYDPLYRFNNIPSFNVKEEFNKTLGIYPPYLWNQSRTRCREGRASVVPVMLYNNGKLSPGLLYIRVCVLKGQNYKGMTLPEITYKAVLKK